MSDETPETTLTEKQPFLSNRAYDTLKFLAQIFLPGLGTLYAALAAFWGFPEPEKVVGSIIAFDLFLGTLLGLSTKRYNDSDAKYDGEVSIIPLGSGQKGVDLKFNGPPETVEDKKALVFKVNPTEEV